MEPTHAGPGRSLLQLRVGAFILGGLVVLAGLVYFLGRQSGMFERQYTLRAPFAYVGGLIEGATVRLAGVPVGRVTAIRLPEMTGNRVEVELAIVRRVQNRIRTDSVARIETLGLLGDKIVEVTLGSAQAAVLPDRGLIQTEEPLDTNRVMKQGTELLRNLVDISADLKGAVAKITESAAGPDLVDTVRAIRSLAREIEQGQGVLHRLIYDPRLGTAVADAAGTLRQLTETARRLNQLVGDPRATGLVADARRAIGEAADAMRQVHETARRLDGLLADPRTAGLVDEARRTVAEAREAMERVNRVAREVEQGRGLLHGLIYGESRLVEDLDRLLGRADALVAAVERGEGTLGILLRDQEAARATRRVVAAADGLARSLERARESDGLLPALLFDPRGKELVGDLREVARHFREVTGRVARGEGLLGQLTQPGTEDTVKQFAQGLAGLGQLGSDLARDGRLGEALADLRTAMANLREITGRIEAGEGTIGGLVQDPTIYENLAAFL